VAIQADLRQGVHVLKGLQHRCGLSGPSGQCRNRSGSLGDGTGSTSKTAIGAVVQSEGIAGVKDARAVIEGEDRGRGQCRLGEH